MAICCNPYSLSNRFPHYQTVGLQTHLLSKCCVHKQVAWVYVFIWTHSLIYLHTYLTYLHTYLLTYSMEQSPSWDANWFSDSQEIPQILWNPKVLYRIHKYPPPVPILSQLGPVHTPTPTSRRSILILSSHLHLSLPSGLLPSGFPTKTLL